MEEQPAGAPAPVVATILVVLFVLTSPLVIAHHRVEKRERAMSDSRTLGRAILAFHLDTNGWPVNDDADAATGEVSLLVGLPGESEALDRPDWGARDWARASIEDHLIRNARAGLAPIHPPSDAAPDRPGWNGPYLDSVPLDPWGGPFVCNTRHLEGARLPGVGRLETERHAVFCLSAGPNRTFDTPLADDTPLVEPGGDDVGWPIQRASIQRASTP
ncbi:MAG: hypothetical protein ACQGVC_11285 [Myxococcota bacterium]